MLEKYLVDLENRISIDVEEKLLADWREFTDGGFAGNIFVPRRTKKAAPGLEWPVVKVNDTLDDYGMMALQQLTTCSAWLADGAGNIMNARCNYGTGIMPSLFGAELFIMDEDTNTLPTTRPIPGGITAMERLVERGVPDLQNGLGAKTFEMARRFVEVFKGYPKISKYVHLYHPDMQGPMDIVELLWGSDMFLDMVDRPDLMKALLELVTETYIRFMREWEKISPFGKNVNVHWAMMHKGAIMLRDDSAMNLSPEMFDEFIKPYDQELLSEFGGGGLHFCGRGSHYIESACEMTGLNAIAMSQPDYNNMEVIYKNTVDKGIQLICFSKEEAMKAASEGRSFYGNIQCF